MFVPLVVFIGAVPLALFRGRRFSLSPACGEDSRHRMIPICNAPLGAHNSRRMGLATSQCLRCGGAYGFKLSTFRESRRSETHVFGQTIICPHCNEETAVAIPIPDAPARAKGGSTGNFISCPTCRTRISMQAATCPKCGHELRSPGAFNIGDPVHFIGILLCIFILFGCIVFMLVRLGAF